MAILVSVKDEKVKLVQEALSGRGSAEENEMEEPIVGMRAGDDGITYLFYANLCRVHCTTAVDAGALSASYYT
jgi:hypothetical protein